MKRSVIETILGAIVLFIAGFFLVFSYNTANIKQVDGYKLQANFSNIGGLSVGDAVQVSGVKIGSVSGVEIDAETYLAVVSLSIDPEYQLPIDTAAVISSESLLGGRFLSLEPGAEEDYLEDGDKIDYTQAPQNLEQLLGQFIFSMQSGNDDDDEVTEAAAEGKNL